jgi:hypothetical protein
MDPLDQDIETVRQIAQDAWKRGALVNWFLASCVVLGWTIARVLGAE